MPAQPLRRVLSAAAAALTITALTSCGLLDGPPVATPERTTPAEPDVPAEFYPEGSAADNLPYFTETVRAFADSESAVEGKPLVDALASAGFAKDHMEVSFDESKTGLTADHLYAAVRIDADCLIAQLVTEDRTFAVETAPAVGPERNHCLIGETRAIDW